MADITNMKFSIAAAKDFDYSEEHGSVPDWKYLDEADSCKEAMEKFATCKGYPIVELHLETTWDDGTRTRVDLLNANFEEVLVDGRWTAK